ncbi:efflux RND transporter periplasmic adaptor subunit [Candidatus Kaiserbacteria bacterium]|nr:efflux RND transporter periplasmic adaptor subunit [Candidatus Kaiserbacteria bacterium]
MKSFFRSKKFVLFLVLIVVLAGGYFYNKNGVSVLDEVEIESVKRADVREVISETGFVEAAREVSLAFERGGRVEKVLVKEGDFVEEGTVLVELDKSELFVELGAAHARLRAEESRLEELLAGADDVSLSVTGSSVDYAKTAVENAKQNLQKVSTQQNQLVAAAKKTLLVSGLQAYLTSGERENSSDSFMAPTITGVYDSAEEGVYYIELFESGSPSGSSFRYSGLENGTGAVSSVNPVRLGTRGLFVQFPDDFAGRTKWKIEIPNKNSSVYLVNKNNYEVTLETAALAIESADSAVKSAEAALAQSDSQYTQVSSSARDERVVAQRALVNQMNAAVQAVELAIEKSSIKAPFSGVVTRVFGEEGEIVAPSSPMVNLISDDNFELKVSISESDIQEITLGDTAVVIFDAYDDDVFEAEVVRVAPIASLSEGVRVFEVTLQFTEKNPKIKAGLSADIDILAAERIDVLAVPTRSVVERDGDRFVRTWDGLKLDYIKIETGLRGSDGQIEILSGVTEGQDIITFAREDTIEKLENSN